MRRGRRSPIDSRTSARTTEAQSIADSISKDLKTTADMERVAAARGLKVQESGFFLKDEPIAGLGPSPEVSERGLQRQARTP